MSKKKWLALLLALLLGIGTLTGCSTTELNYLNLVKEVSSQKVYTDTGSIEINAGQLPASFFTGNGAPSEEVIRKALDQYRIEYTGQVDVNQDTCQYDFYIVDKTSSIRYPLSTVIYQKNMAYIKINSIINCLQRIDPMEQQAFDMTFHDVEWVKITDEDLRNMDPGNIRPITINNLLQKNSRQQAIIFRLYDGIINDAYANYTPNLISQNGNQYVLTLRSSQLIDITKSASTYTINNIDKIGNVLKAFISSLSPTELAELGLNNESQVKAVEGIDLMVAQVMFNRQKYLNELQQIDAASQQEFLSFVNDSEIVSTLEKINDGTYNMSARIHLNITGIDPADIFNIVITNNYTLKAGGTIQITVPTENVISLTDLSNRLP